MKDETRRVDVPGGLTNEEARDVLRAAEDAKRQTVDEARLYASRPGRLQIKRMRETKS